MRSAPIQTVQQVVMVDGEGRIGELSDGDGRASMPWRWIEFVVFTGHSDGQDGIG